MLFINTSKELDRVTLDFTLLLVEHQSMFPHDLYKLVYSPVMFCIILVLPASSWVISSSVGVLLWSHLIALLRFMGLRHNLLSMSRLMMIPNVLVLSLAQ